MRVRRYGKPGALVIVLHGGPGTAGYLAPLARGLADTFRVSEPFQRGSGAEPLTVARHIADLHELVETSGAGPRPALVGHSWGAMLALAYAASYPEAAAALVLVGSGTFDPAARARRVLRRTARMAEPASACASRLACKIRPSRTKVNSLLYAGFTAGRAIPLGAPQGAL